MLVAAIAVKVAAGPPTLPLETRFYTFVFYALVQFGVFLFRLVPPRVWGFVRLPAHAAIETFSAAYRAGAGMRLWSNSRDMVVSRLYQTVVVFYGRFSKPMIVLIN